MFTIEKNVPIPEETSRGRPVMYNWSDMELGDSFFAPIADLDQKPNKKKTGELKKSRRSGVNNSFTRWRTSNPSRLRYKIVTRSWVGEDGVPGIRVWLVER